MLYPLKVFYTFLKKLSFLFFNITDVMQLIIDSIILRGNFKTGIVPGDFINP